MANNVIDASWALTDTDDVEDTGTDTSHKDVARCFLRAAKFLPESSVERRTCEWLGNGGWNTHGPELRYLSRVIREYWANNGYTIEGGQ